MKSTIVQYNEEQHREQVIALWSGIFGYALSHNNPATTIDAKIRFSDGLFFVAMDEDTVVGTIMAGYDGHRGWIYSVAVSPSYRNRGIGKSLVAYAEKRLSALGCMKINLQIMVGNDTVIMFYEKCGYEVEQRISMGKKVTLTSHTE